MSEAKRIYVVRIHKETFAMVQADSESAALAIARREEREIFRDCPDDVGVDVRGEIQTLAQLERYGWDGMCLPYGGDGNSRLSEILPATATGEQQ